MILQIFAVVVAAAVVVVDVVVVVVAAGFFYQELHFCCLRFGLPQATQLGIYFCKES